MVNMEKIVGRKEEVNTLKRLYHSDKSEFVAIYGRRRVGKTYLVNQVFKNEFSFKHTGLSPFDDGASIGMREQLQAFQYSLFRNGYTEFDTAPSDWFEAFFRLEKLLQSKPKGHKKVVFLDEMPWMDTPRSRFISAFEGFYNGWAAAQDDILLVVCGSSSSWILKNIINSKGGLYDRITCRIKLLPLTLKETEDFLRLNNSALERYDIVQAYMALGGIPYYLGYVKSGQSVEQNIDDILFKDNAPLNGEFQRLFNTLFTNSEQYIKIVRCLSRRNYGYTREEISAQTHILQGGGLTGYLDRLAEADFVEKYKPAMTSGKSEYYRLKDCFSIFYLRFIDGQSGLDPHFWQNNSSAQKIKSWQGFAFEQVCLSHINSIRKALGISGIVTRASNMLIPSDNNTQGTQLDLVIERGDRNVNVCEMKFYSSEVSVDKEESLKLRNRVSALRQSRKIKGNVFLTLVTTFGLKYGLYSGVYNKVLTLDDLFA